jgi:tetratricopeptide (TPR) repeat protein
LWASASTEPETAARALRYRNAMMTGHRLGETAMELVSGAADPVPPALRVGAVNRAVQAFRDAAAIDDSQAEPHYYIATLLLQARIDCRTCTFEAKIAAAAVEALDKFEARSPLDPRLTPLLSRRAILETRLSGTVSGDSAQAHLLRALADYRTVIERSPPSRLDSDVVYGNLAETLMMLGKVEESLDYYRQALRARPSTSNALGLAVALDRDERGTEARTLIRDLGSTGIGEWESSVADGNIFYVPEGEVFYYRAIIEESLGKRDDAIALYNQFIRSGAHPQFAERAAANRDALRAKGR